MTLKGLSWNSIKNTPSLIPLFLVVGAGVGAAIMYPLRCAMKSPDVSWSKKKEAEPWNDYADKQYKFFATKKPEVTPPPKF